ncbi:small ubiquitin-related modifier 2-B-like [Vombatus ursinus]|uniref:small ubiquitin-related modifier 2-B-like n=1 Tax=Vombatus ursinus TaxID=29139 RepID=UPI000FFD2BAF|nr:small ubiquitin-related modifier 2-B-like [Vombatus ursinus]
MWASSLGADHPDASFVKRQLRRPLDLPKEGIKTENNNHINLKVVGQDGSVVQFKIKRHTPLSKLMKAYSEQQVGNGGEDTIDVFQHQTGGTY